MTENSEVKTYTYPNGAVYEGTFNGNMREGRGYWHHPQGETYEGEYHQNKPHGLGTYIFSDTGKQYFGHWSDGFMHGDGVYYFSKDRSTYYCGGYQNDKKHGHGYYMYENGVMSVQEWTNGVLQTEREATPIDLVHCTQKITTILSSIYPIALKTTSDGVLITPSEVRTFQFPSGATYTGQYYGAKKHGQGNWLHPEGDSYEGQFLHNKHSGWGVYIIGRSGKKYVGHWANGKMNGVGVYFFNPQETEYFVGCYREDQKHGKGLYHFAESGRSQIQFWENGVLKGEKDILKEEEEAEKVYMEGIRKIVEVVRTYAPNYAPIAFPS